MSRAPFPSGGISCKICEKHVGYNAGKDADVEFGKYRRFCSHCRQWVHYWCFVPSEALCLECSGPSLAAMKMGVEDLEFGTQDEKNTALLVMSAWSVGTDESDLAKFTGLSEEFIHPRAERLRQSGVWSEDGKIIIDASADMKDCRHLQIVIILHTLCAEGMIVCSNKEHRGDSEEKVI